MLPMTPSHASRRGGAESAVTVAGASFGYEGRAAVLSIPELVLRVGTLTALVGPNGSGKSTLLAAIAGLLRPREGSVEVLGEPAERVRRRVAYVLQSTRADEVLPVTVHEVVTMARFAVRGPFRRLRTEDRRAVDGAVARLELEHLARRHLRDLSGGERQRVLVAQGLAQEAPVLLLDEPVTGLDLVSRRRIFEAITEERDRGTAVVMATHDLEDAQLADEVVVLAGRVVAAGRPSKVLRTEQLTEAYGGRLHVHPAGPLMDPHVHVHADD